MDGSGIPESYSAQAEADEEVSPGAGEEQRSGHRDQLRTSVRDGLGRGDCHLPGSGQKQELGMRTGSDLGEEWAAGASRLG